MTDTNPRSGGSYIRDAKTGALTRSGSNPTPASSAEAAVDQVDTSSTKTKKKDD